MRISLALPLFAFLAATPAHAQGSAEAAKAKNSMCIGCHGIPMYKTAFPEVYSVPMIAGQAPEYIVKALQAYRAGDLLGALARWPEGRQPATDAERVWQAALLLGAGQAEAARASLAPVGGSAPVARTALATISSGDLTFAR